MRIALVALHFAEYSARLALALAQQHTVLLILRTDNANNELSSALRDALTSNVQIVLIDHRQLRQPSVFTTAWRLVRTVKAFKPEILHFQEYPVDYATWAVLRLMLSYPTVLTVHDHIAHSGIDSRLSLRMRIYRKILRRKASRIIVHGEAIRHEMQMTSSPPVVSIMHGVLGVDGTIGSLVLPPDSNTLLFFGRIETYKGLSTLLDALDQINLPNENKVKLTIAGRGSDLDLHRNRIAKCPWIEVNDRYIPAEALPDLFHKASIVVLPYLDATQSGVAAMAFAFGRPVIASATGALPEVVHPERNGILVRPADVKGLASAIRSLTSDKVLWERLAHGALDSAMSDLSWQNIAATTSRVYEETISNSHGVELIGK